MLGQPADSGRSLRPWLALVAGVLIGGAAGYLFFFGLPSAQVDPPPVPTIAVPQQVAITGLDIGDLAPSFTLETADGDALSLQDHVGDVVLLNFWATWCVPCRVEMPLLESMYAANKGSGFVVLAVNFDESRDLVTGFGEELGLTFPLLLDPGGEVQDLYRVRGYPTSVVLDREGRIVNYHIGVLTKGQLEEYLSEAGLSQ